MYDLDCVDDQHSHGKSVGKYHMVNRVKRTKNFELDHCCKKILSKDPFRLGIFPFGLYGWWKP